jgi:hypothetical protein
LPFLEQMILGEAIVINQRIDSSITNAINQLDQNDSIFNIKQTMFDLAKLCSKYLNNFNFCNIIKLIKSKKICNLRNKAVNLHLVYLGSNPNVSNTSFT